MRRRIGFCALVCAAVFVPSLTNAAPGPAHVVVGHVTNRSVPASGLTVDVAAPFVGPTSGTIVYSCCYVSATIVQVTCAAVGSSGLTDHTLYASGPTNFGYTAYIRVDSKPTSGFVSVGWTSSPGSHTCGAPDETTFTFGGSLAFLG